MDRKIVENISEEQIEVAPVISGVGATLKIARDATGKSLPEVATLLRIRQPYLQALEEGRHRDLPGGTYAIGFLRTYADFLGLDGEEMVRLFRLEAAGDLHSRSELIFPSPVTEGRVPGGAILFIGLILAVVIYGAWYWLSSRTVQVGDMVPSLPERLSSILHRPADLGSDTTKPAEPVEKATDAATSDKNAQGTSSPASADGEPAASSGALPVKDNEVVPPAETDEDTKTKPATPPANAAKPTDAKPTDAKPVAPKPNDAKPADGKSAVMKPAETKPAEKEKPAEPVVAPGQPASATDVHASNPDNTASRVVLTASGDDCWIQVREMDGQLLASRLMRKGDSYAVPNRPGLVLMVGNAGALDITVDGKKAPSLGAMGLVRRDIRLDPDKVMNGG